MHARVRTTISTAIGLMIGLALAATAAVAPATAATYSCSYFNGRTITANTVSVNSVGLKAGEVIGVKVSPARVGDTIILTAASGQAVTFLDEPATSGLNYKAAYDGTFNFSWSLEASGTRPSSITWSFTCSTGGSTGAIADADRDGVANTADACASTILPDSIKRATTGRYYAQASGRFVDGTGAAAGVTVVDAGGCSATQIANALGLRKVDAQSGITLTQLKNWAATH